MDKLSQLINLRNLLIVGVILGGAYFLNSKSEETEYISPAEIEEYGDYEVMHPFPLEATNLLDDSLGQGSLLQSRLNKYDVRSAMNKVLIDGEFKASIDTFVTVGDLTIPVTSYDPYQKIGYLWLDFDRFGEGIMDKKLGNIKTQVQCENDFLKSIDDGLELFLDNEKTFIDDIFGTDEDLAQSELDRIEQEWRSAMEQLQNREVQYVDVRDKFELYQSTFNLDNSILDNWGFFGKTLNSSRDYVKAYGDEIRLQLESFQSFEDKKEYMETFLKEFRKILEVNHLSRKSNKSMLDEWKLSAAKVIKEPTRFFGFIGQIDQLRIHGSSQKLFTALDAQIFQIDLYENSKEWWKHSKAVLELFNVNKDPGLYNKDSYYNLLADIMTNSNYKKWDKQYAVIEELGNLENISIRELKALNFLAFQKGIYIAPLSILDDRLIYDMEEEKYQAELSAIREKINTSRNKTKRKTLQKELLEMTSNRANNYNDIRKEAKMNSIEGLQKDFEEYIQWAKEETERRLAETGV